MAVIKVKTPQGIQQVRIAGDAPTPEEEAAIRQQFFGDGETTSTKKQKQKDPTNALGAFASGFSDPLGLKGLKKKVSDKISKAQDDYEGGGSSKSGSNKDTLTRGGLNAMKKELGIENPAMAIRAINKIQNGRPPNKQELESVAPLIDAMEKALGDQQGRARLKQLIKMMNSK